MKVLKFGGSSVKDADKIKNAVSIIKQSSEHHRPVAVFSAMKGITDMLIESAAMAESGDPLFRKHLQTITERQKNAAAALLPETKRKETETKLLSLLEELGDILHGVELVRELSPRSKDLIMSFGERLNCTLIADYMQTIGIDAYYQDARELILTDNKHGSAAVCFQDTYNRVAAQLESKKGIPIITGFIASSEEGITTTLGRNGSDYTASIIGAAVHAEAIEIWTDVDGVLSADPRYVPQAFVLPVISFQEAMELSYFGAEVIHPYTMVPAVERNIPVIIKNTQNPSALGTVIHKPADKKDKPITGIASIEQVSLINIEGSGMVGIPGIASRIFSALAKAGANIIMISQASSEHSICVVIKDDEVKQAVLHLNRELSYELESKKLQRVQVVKDLEIVAIIGENMRGTPGISGRLFSALGDKQINVYAIAQGSSELNISFVISSKDREEALRTIHNAFLERI
ncbi:MAG: aspartate kinase [Spirochaetia bacterium]